VIGGVSEEFLRFMISQSSAGNVSYPETCYELGTKWLFHRPQSPGVYQAMLDQSLEWPQYVLNTYAASMCVLDHRARLPSLRCPTVIVQGRYDQKQRYDGAVHMAQLIPGARLFTLEDRATMTNIEEVDAFNQILTQFVSELEAKRKEAA
jgi:pimeloyl-ACP methyl ester carboxylesterase